MLAIRVRVPVRIRIRIRTHNRRSRRWRRLERRATGQYSAPGHEDFRGSWNATGRYTRPMRSVADDGRDADARSLASMSPDERVSLALRLGDDDLEIYCRAQGIDREEGLRRLRMARQAGRVRCICLDEGG